MKPSECPDCRYLFEERAAIHEFDGGATRADAERMAREADERCPIHERKVEQSEMFEAPDAAFPK